MSAIDPTLSQPLHKSVPVSPDTPELQSLIKILNLQTHPEGGYFAETDRDPVRIPNPFSKASLNSVGNDDATRNASTTIYYLLTPQNPMGVFHRNKGRTVHTLHQGRGRYVVIHADEGSNKTKKRVETFVVGPNVSKGERLQWVVEGGKFKVSFLLPDAEGEEGSVSSGLLISETVIPGFEFIDHDFLEGEALKNLVTVEQEKELRWLVKKGTN